MRTPVAIGFASLILLVGCTLLVRFDETAGTLGVGFDSGDDDATTDDEGGSDEDAADPDVEVTFDGGDDGPDPDASDGNPCANRPNGYPWKSGSSLSRCCDETPVTVDTTSNCGSCGIQCPAGESCGAPAGGRRGCHCASDTSCQQAGYGSSATCYQGYCNCQCPGGAVTCTGLCRGGSICHDVSGQNYCSY